MTDKSAVTHNLNDRFRKGDVTVPGQIFITSGLMSLMAEKSTEPTALAKIVQDYDDFSPDNDPYGEHDFGAFDFLGSKCFWKIDYYDPSLKWGSEDPSDTSKTTRVLTILLASEY